MADRRRVQMQRTLFKLTQVAAYWRRQAKDTVHSSHLGLRMQVAFSKWKNMVNFGRAELQIGSRLEAILSSKHPKVLLSEQQKH